MKDHVFRSLSSSFKRIPAKIVLQTVTASSMKVLGRVFLLVTLAGVTASHCFYMVHNMNWSAIPGHDFLSRTGAILDYKSHTLHIHKKITFEQNVHIASILWVHCSSILSPHSMNVIPL